jgi:hypothetical protein
MDDETRRPGWHADPNVPGELRYWDGRAWGTQVQGSTTRSREPGAAGPGFQRLANVLGVFLVIALLILAARVAVYVWAFLTVGDAVESGDVDLLTRFDDLDTILTVSVVAAIIPTGVCWMLWQYRAARAVPGLERSPAMHAFSWLIPIAALWLPFQNVRELWRRSVRGRTTATVGWWWTGWIVAGLLGRVASSAADSADTVSGLRAGLFVGAGAGLLGTVAAVLALRIVRSVSAGVVSGDFVDHVKPARTLDGW